MLTRIEAENVKGQSFSYELSEGVAVIGPNFQGKTSVMDAIRLALIGYLPEVGKRASATWELSSGQRMSVTAHFSDGAFIQRAFADAKADHPRVSPPDFDFEAFESLPLLDAAHYFSLSEKDRVEYVFSRISLPESFTADNIIAQAERMTLEERHTEAVEKAKRNMIAAVRQCFDGSEAGRPPRAPGMPKPSVQDALADAVRRLKDLYTYWNSRVKETVGTVRVLTELKNREAEAGATSIDDLDKQITRFEGELSELNQTKGKIEAERKEAERVAGRIKQLEQILGEDRIDHDRVIARLQKQLDDAKKAIKPITITEADVRRRDENVREIAAKRADLQVLHNAMAEACEQLEQLTHLKSCPYCKSSQKGWQANVEADLRKRSDELKAQWEEKSTYLNGLEKGDKALKAAIEEARDQRNLNDAYQRTINTCENGIALAEKDKVNDAAYRKEMQEELDRLLAVPKPTHADAQSETIAQAIADVQTQLNFVRASKTKLIELQQDIRRAAQAQIEHLDAQAHLTVVKELGKLISGVRSAMTEEAFNTLLKTANSICQGILRSPLAMHEGTIGRWSGANFIPHRVFSGVEKDLTYVAIAAALSSTAPLRLLLLDELGRMTEKVRAGVMHNIRENVQIGNLDQAIVVIPSDVGLAFSAWQVIPMFGNDDRHA